MLPGYFPSGATTIQTNEYGHAWLLNFDARNSVTAFQQPLSAGTFNNVAWALDSLERSPFQICEVLFSKSTSTINFADTAYASFSRFTPGIKEPFAPCLSVDAGSVKLQPISIGGGFYMGSARLSSTQIIYALWEVRQ